MPAATNRVPVQTTSWNCTSLTERLRSGTSRQAVQI